MSRQHYIVDIESTSLTPSYADGSGVIWELGLIQYGAPDDPAFRQEHLYRMKPDPSKADPGALAVGKYYERTRDMCGTCERPACAYDLTEPPLKGDKYEWSSPRAVARLVAPMLSNVTLVAAVPSFDATKFLAAFLAHYGESREPWHFRLRDIGSMAYGFLCGKADGGSYVPRPEMDAGTDDFAEALGVDVSRIERHSALGDCRLVAACLDVITGAA